MRPAPALLLALVLLPCCASAAGPRDTAGWFEARGADLMDIVGVRVSVGVGLGVYVRATEWLQLGYMRLGPSERELPAPEGVELRALPCFVFGTIGRYGGAWFESSEEIMIPGWDSRESNARAIERDVIVGYVSPDGRQDDWRGSFGFGVQALLVGVAAEVRPLEVFDFIGGLVGYDPSGDDVPFVSSGREETPES